MIRFLLSAILALSLTACERPGDDSNAENPAIAQTPPTGKAEPAESASDPGVKTGTDVIEVVTTEYAIEAPDRLPLGWHRMRLENRGNQTHFVYMYRIADGKTIDDQLANVVEPFDRLLAGLQDGSMTKQDIGPFIEAEFPEWAYEMTGVGGVGLVAPGGAAETSFQLTEPGTYLVECYVKSPDGSWHTSMGMLTQVEVSDEQGGGEEPTADAEISLTNAGIDAPPSLPTGPQTVRVNIVDTPESFMPYDVHVVRIDQDTSMDDVVFWMDWSNVGGLRAPAPATFVGGLENMPGGNYGYVHLDLEPGRYAWISETAADTMRAQFTVSD